MVARQREAAAAHQELMRQMQMHDMRHRVDEERREHDAHILQQQHDDEAEVEAAAAEEMHTGGGDGSAPTVLRIEQMEGGGILDMHFVGSRGETPAMLVPGGSVQRVIETPADGAAPPEQVLPPPVAAKEGQKECVVCLINVPTIVLLPCKHLHVCSTCWEAYKKTQNGLTTCPVCKSRVMNTIAVFV